MSHTYARPIGFGARGYLATAEGVDAITTCIQTILDTAPGEIEMEPTFGSRLPALRQEPNDAALAREMEHETAEAVATWEKRVTVERATIRQSERRTDADVALRLRGGTRVARTIPLASQR